ncbi:MAG: ATPase, partial [Chloroflexota bacterium]|nr:ATPase [Chloroflexota bacterium]
VPARPASAGSDRSGAPLPAINAGDQHLPGVSAAAWAALNAANDPPRLFRFGGLPARLDKDDDHGPPVPRTLTEDRLRYELARAADWYKPSEKSGATPALPPVAVVRDMLAAPRFPFPQLAAIIEAPAFAPDGSLPAGPGYHAAGRTYYAPAAGLVVPTIPNDPTPAEIAAARELIVEDFLGDFPFTGDAERAHAVALLLLPFVRGLVAGPTPLHLIEKPTPGTGASLLADVLTRLATGRPVGAMAEGRDEDEWRKRITAKLRGAPAVVLLDNLRRRLDSATLSIALTAAEWTDRLLGTSDDLRLPVRCAWVATGNNPALSSEIARRTVRIRLDAQRDRPWLREGFRHPNLGGWTLDHRGELIGACLTLGQAWIAAGGPVSGDAHKLGSYEEWSRVLGGILDTAGVPGFLGNLAEFYEQTDTEGSAIRGFLRAWWEQHHGAPVGVGDLFTVASAPESGLDLGDKGERSQRIRLGNRLKELRDRQYQLADDLTVRIADAGTAQRAQLWRLVPTGTETQTAAAWGAGESGESGECSESTSNPHGCEETIAGEIERNGYGRETFTTFTTFTDPAPDRDEVSV